MKYIVWNTYDPYLKNQGGGYFVRYKDKITNQFSPNWFEANRYQSMESAILRLRLKLNNSPKSLEDFFNTNPLSKSCQRQRIITDLLDPDTNQFEFLEFERGHIDKIDDRGNFIGNAGEDVIQYVLKHIKSNMRKFELNNKKYLDLGIRDYIDKSIPDEDFWNEILKN